MYPKKSNRISLSCVVPKQSAVCITSLPGVQGPFRIWGLGLRVEGLGFRV